LNIVKAALKDLPDIMDLIRLVIKDMNDCGNDQWNDQYPRTEVFEKDIKDGTLYAMRDGGNIVGIIVITEEMDKEYEDVKWEDSDGKPIVFHRIAVVPGLRRQGIADGLNEFAEDLARRKGFTSIRLDTYHKNVRSQALIEKHGYRRIPGVIHFPDCDGPFFCYEKRLK
jgi:ribosomal protein S18 acetylase RimI-like enzyme